MTDSSREKPDHRSERERRLADALRANLKRRKAQQRQRAAPPPKTNRQETDDRVPPAMKRDNDGSKEGAR